METLDVVKDFFKIEDFNKLPVEIPGKDRDDLAKLFAALGYQVGAEIGVLRGDYSETLCKANPTVKHYCIDPYLRYLNHFSQDELNDAEQEAMLKLQSYNAHFIKEPSIVAADRFEDKSLDYVYIDGNHEFPYVVEDLTSWVKKVRPGGIISGHDYYISTWRKSVLHVVYAVDGWAKSYKINPWFVLGTMRDVKKDWSKRYRSWFWVVK